MPDISKINALAIGSVAKVDGLAKASILDINGVTVTDPGINPSAPTSGFLFTYSGSSAAFSVRQLNNNADQIMRVRRASDNVEADVGFDASNELSLTSPISNTSDAQSYTDLADFVDHTGTPTNAFVRWWYDQSSNQNHAGQATASNQPQIYNGTAVFTEGTNSKAAIQFDRNSNDRMTMNAEESIQFFTHSMVYNQAASQRFNFMVSSNIANYYRLETSGLMYLVKANDFDSASGAMGLPGYALRILIRDTSSTATAYVDASSSNAWTALDASNMRFRNIDANYITTGTGYTVTHQEFILWSDAKSSTDRAGIETSTNSYFGIY